MPTSNRPSGVGFAPFESIGVLAVEKHNGAGRRLGAERRALAFDFFELAQLVSARIGYCQHSVLDLSDVAVVAGDHHHAILDFAVVRLFLLAFLPAVARQPAKEDDQLPPRPS